MANGHALAKGVTIDIFWLLLVLLGFARLAGALSVRVGQPALMGELLSGVVLGIAVTHLEVLFPAVGQLRQDEVLMFLADLGIFFLMLVAGVHLSPSELKKASLPGAVVGTAGFLLPLALGAGLGWWLLPESEHLTAQALFLGTALAATAVPITVKVLMDLGQLESRLGRTVLSAAAVDDVLTLFALAILTSIVELGELPPAGDLVLMVLYVLGFFVGTWIIGRFVYPWFGRLLVRSRVVELELSGLMVMALIFAVAAEELGMHFLLGPFLAGVYWVQSTTNQETFDRVSERVSGLTHGIFAPVFFASVGLGLQPGAVAETPLLVGLVVLAAFVGKFVGTSIPARLLGFTPRRALALGAAMNARGAVELIIADIALRAGLFEAPDHPMVRNLFAATVVMALVTTLAAPPLMRALLGDDEPAPANPDSGRSG